ncbi:23S rRNA (adenine(2503)-C(2))-methyltransferase RlmN [Thermoflavifilum thermophilum]|uniref:Probable dual-specificity RNA methyltransferase RlmN n=1 Tax=Thermoflavifilum thermophilum TaxID=1393122 RepID=A0A1I7N7Z0_9BACT|nr:23S rRNA (adenine(2503)-C(2))-methyltransferase RlmN [Thermoflavifilum thermophilum]SFV30676.1 23S rRNA (adenine2503-C2)-methyltransferase [Thermoflavifilum thermophilum]
MKQTSVRPNIRHLSLSDLQEYVAGAAQPAYRARQLYGWLWQKHARSFEQMSDLPKTFREKLANDFSFPVLNVELLQQSRDGTVKCLFRLSDGKAVEGVLIPSGDRLTACVSSQAGCSLGCKFCATGYLGLQRNLMFEEIFDQVAFLNEIAMQQAGRRLTNIVFMGMGEPLLNYKQVLLAIDKITSPDGLAFSPRRITLSTAGISKMIYRLADDQVKFNLALSLHAATDEKRSQIMPINQSNRIPDLLEALEYFYKLTRNEISIEYILLKDFNDSLDDAKALVKLYRKLPFKVVNLIEYNPVSLSPFSRTESHVADQFIAYLQRQHVNVRLRRSRGADIDAACGQLANVVHTEAAQRLPHVNAR